MKLMSQTEYAAHRGISQPRVHKLIKTGKIPPECLTKDGKYTKIIVDQADQALAHTLDPAQKKRGKIPQSAPIKKKKITFEEARTRNEVIKSELNRIKLDIEQGKFILASDAEAAAFNVARSLRDAVGAIPDRVSSILAAERDEFKIREILIEEYRQAWEGVFNAGR